MGAKRKKRSNRVPTGMKPRRRTPLVHIDGDKHVLMCPFCSPSHPIDMMKEAHCGTTLECYAVQPVIRAKQIKCLKCEQAGGTFVKAGTGYVHDFDCAPERKLMYGAPKMNRFAGAIFNRSVKFNEFFTKYTGKRARKALKLDENQELTDEVFGYFFEKVEKE